MSVNLVKDYPEIQKLIMQRTGLRRKYYNCLWEYETRISFQNEMKVKCQFLKENKDGLVKMFYDWKGWPVWFYKHGFTCTSWITKDEVQDALNSADDRLVELKITVDELKSELQEFDDYVLLVIRENNLPDIIKEDGLHYIDKKKLEELQ